MKSNCKKDKERKMIMEVGEKGAARGGREEFSKGANIDSDCKKGAMEPLAKGRFVAAWGRKL